MFESSTMASGKFVGWVNAAPRGVAITGASGWIGRAMAHAALEGARPDTPFPLRLFGASNRAIDVSGQTLSLESLEDSPPLDPAVEWIVVHLAVAGSDRDAEPGRLRAANDAMLARAEDFARGANVRRFVAASSGAVHHLGQGSPDRQAYAQLKADQEAQVKAWASDSRTPLLIARIFNVGGPYMNHPERYALGSFVTQALDTGVIEIGAAKPVLRSYVHVLELARVLLDLSLADDPDILIETAGPDVVEMGELALAVGEALGRSLDIRRPPMGSDAQDRYVGDGRTYQAALAGMGAEPILLETIIRDTAAWLRPDHIRL